MRFFYLVILLILSGPLFAQDKAQEMNIEDERRSLNYIPATHANLSQLTWRFGLYDVNDDAVLDNYLLAKNCQLHKKYYGEDFLWQNIREATRRDIKYFANAYPQRMEIITYVPLDRYNFDKLAFEIKKNFQLKNGGAIEFPFENPQNMRCNTINYSLDFPNMMRFIPDNSYNILYVPVEPDNADELLSSIEKYSYNKQFDTRYLPMRLRFKINDVSKENKGKYKNLFTFTGSLDEIMFFEDPEMTKPIWGKKFTDLQ